MQDPFFTTENIALYSTEAEKRADQLRNVEYTMLLKLTDKEDTGFEGTMKVSFDYCPKGF